MKSHKPEIPITGPGHGQAGSKILEASVFWGPIIEPKTGGPKRSLDGPIPRACLGHGGRVGSTKGSLLTQYLLKQGGLIKEIWMDEDPGEPFLKYADVAAKDPKFIAPAYAQTQPEPVFAKSDSEDEEK